MIPLLDSIPPVRGRRGRPRRRPRERYGDRAYTRVRAGVSCVGAASRRRSPAEERARLRARHKRWIVERTIAWLHQYRRLRIRYERRDDIHEAFLAIGCSLICLKLS
jgi:transposase